MKITLPSTCATPRPSWSRDSTSTAGPTESRFMLGLPAVQEFAPVRIRGFGERRTHQIAFAAVLCLVECTADQLEALINEVSVGHVSLAVMPDRLDPARLVGLPDFRAVHAEFSRKAEQLRDLVERRIATALIHRQHIHQVEMAAVIAAYVIVPLEVAVILAHVPETRGTHAVNQRPVIEHRQIEAAAVPRNQLRRVLLDAIEEALDQVVFGFARLAQRPDAEAVAVAQRAGNC